ncbi:MAG: Hint domain-containing protein [Planctomycetaceae bacterium]
MSLCSCYVVVSLAMAISESPGSDVSANRVRELLVSESLGELNTDRVSALRQLRTANANEAWWHSGFVRIDGTWTQYQQAVEEVRSDKNTHEYKRRRAEAKTGSGHWRLANWCKSNGMAGRHRIHATEAIRIDARAVRWDSPDDLGLVELAGVWVTPKVAARLQQEARYQEHCFDQWNDACENIVRKLAGNAAEVREGERLLSEISSPDAVLMIDYVIGQSGPKGTRYAVQTLSRIESVRSTRVLAKYAMWSPVKSIRDTAISALCERNVAHFVPSLLDLLATEITEENSPIQIAPFNRNFWALPDFVFRQTFSRESRNNIAIRKSTLRIRPRFVVRRFSGATRAQVDRYNQNQFGNAAARLRMLAQQANYQRSRMSGNINEVTRNTNDRIFAVLATVTEANFETPKQWWSWWDDHVGVDISDKPVIEVEEVQLLETKTTVALAQPPGSCFGKGTLVRTDEGPKPIETIRMGDRVLAQNIHTGEIEFCVVERPTIRPQPGPALTVRIGEEKIVCTPGHEIWKNGSGWVRAKELQPGDRVRTLTGSMEVRSLEKTEPQITYNLVVAGNHNYFVGEAAFLVQDVTTATPTDHVVPGLSRFDVGGE